MRLGPTAEEKIAESDFTPARAAVLRAVWWNQILWTAGYSLTTGGFLLYFARELGAKGFWISLLIVLPESIGVAGLLGRSVIRTAGGRKTAYVAATCLARLVAIPIPFLAIWSTAPGSLWWLAASVAAMHAVGAIAYVAYLSWLSDLMPRRRWGRLFARREIAKLIMLLIVPVVAGYLRDVWSKHDSLVVVGYFATFLIGQGLLLASVVPMLSMPERTKRTQFLAQTDWRHVREALAFRPMRLLLLHNWSLAFANGLTQSAFFLYSAEFGPLGIGLGTYNLLAGLMRTVQLPISAGAGRACDRFGGLRLRVWGVLIGSTGLIFWLAAVRETWWLLFGAYLLWGAYAAANIAGDKLMLTYAPPSDNGIQISLFAQIGGLLSGIAGLLGGLWLEALKAADFGLVFTTGGFTYHFEGYQLIFLVSLVGRYASVLWLRPLHERSREPSLALSAR